MKALRVGDDFMFEDPDGKERWFRVTSFEAGAFLEAQCIESGEVMSFSLVPTDLLEDALEYREKWKR